MNASTLNGSNITLTGPGGAVAVGQGYLVSGDTYRIPIATQRANGAYQLTIGAGVQDQEGTLLGGSAYQSSFTVSLPDLVVERGDAVGRARRTSATRSPWAGPSPTTARRRRRARGSITSTCRTTPTLGAGAIYLGSFTAENSGDARPRRQLQRPGRPSSFPINSSLAAGTYYLVVLADAGGVVNESDLTTQTEQRADHAGRAAAAGPGGLVGDVVAHRRRSPGSRRR